MRKFNRNHSLLAFYNKQGKIFFQNRKSISKMGEEYGFFGGGVEKWENFEDALIREVKEELNIDLKKSSIQNACEFTKTIAGLGTSKTVIFVAEFQNEYVDTLRVQEGDGGEWLTFDEIKTKKVFPHDYLIIDMLQTYFNNTIPVS